MVAPASSSGHGWPHGFIPATLRQATRPRPRATVPRPPRATCPRPPLATCPRPPRATLPRPPPATIPATGCPGPRLQRRNRGLCRALSLGGPSRPQALCHRRSPAFPPRQRSQQPTMASLGRLYLIPGMARCISSPLAIGAAWTEQSHQSRDARGSGSTMAATPRVRTPWRTAPTRARPLRLGPSMKIWLCASGTMDKVLVQELVATWMVLTTRRNFSWQLR
mmetsp:Transcript_25793/g.54447  ORF Transcript_25793/g.54447 Transcript_25793/m.54447 type:complete len:222 (+) Transcript_25793:55-720(+)